MKGLNVDKLTLKLAFSKFISNESFSLDWTQVFNAWLYYTLRRDVI